MSELKRLTVVSPAYNEQEVIARFYREVAVVLDELRDRYDARLLFVVDRSPDRTLEIVEDIATDDPRVQVLALSSRFGHQMSLLAGIDHASDSDAIVMMDCDLQHPPRLIHELVREFEAGNDVVYTMRSDPPGTNVIRRALVKMFYRAFGYLSDTQVTANGADFRLISGRVARVLRSDVRERNIFLRGIFSWMGFQQSGVAYLGQDRAGGESKYSLSRMIGLALAGVLSFSIKPLRLSILVGIATAMFGFVLGLITTIQYFVIDAIPSGFTTIVTLMLFFTGVQLIFIGVLGAYIGVIYEEVKKRPHYIVDRTRNI